MRKIALFCIICILFLMPIHIYAETQNDITIEVSNVDEDIVTVSGSAPVDSTVAVMVLNPNQTLAQALAEKNISKMQFLGATYSRGGKFSYDIKMNTGIAPNKIEGKFSVFVSIDGELIYSNDNFVFYSNETKTGYLEPIKSGAYSSLVTKVPEIYQAFSLSSHTLYGESTKEDLANAICAQKNRSDISGVTDATDFLTEMLVLSAFGNSSKVLVNADNTIKYTDLWALCQDGNVSELYTDKYINDLSDKGREAVINFVLTADYTGKQFDDIFNVFEESMYFNLIKNNNAMGTAFAEQLITSEYKDEYTKAGFNTELLSSITNTDEKSSKLYSFLECDAKTLSALAAQFNSIFAPEENVIQDMGKVDRVPSGGGGGAFAAAPTPPPSIVPEPSTPALACPFTDLSDAVWATEAVEYLYKNEIINGINETQFAPNSVVKRAELVKMIAEALKIGETDEKVSFDDVEDTDWFASYISRAAAAGIVLGDGGKFRPMDAITREDAAVIIYRALGLEGGGEPVFADAGGIATYAKDAVAALQNKGLVNGMDDGRYNPKATLTRAQAAQLIYNILSGR